MIKLFEQNKKLASFTTIIIAIAIFVISSIPGQGTSHGTNYTSTIYHFFAFFFLQLFLLITTTKKSNTKHFSSSIIISFLYACLDELHQYFVQGRFCSLEDIFTDLGGILLATFMYYKYKKF